MSTKETGGPALPAFPGQRDFGNGCVESWIGMTLRDYFAAKAMQAYLGSYPNGCLTCRPDEIAADAYDVADAMLAERNEE